MIPSVIMLLKRRLKLLQLMRKSKLSYVALVFLASVIINGFLFYLTEGVIGGRQDITLWRALYWAVVTMATVGYGDVTPETTWGTVVTVETVVVGIAVFTMLVSVLAEEFMNASLKKSMGLGRLKRVDILVIGGEETCREALNELQLNEPHVRIGWLLPQPPKQPPQDVEFVAGDPTEESVLKRAGADKASKVILCLSDDSKAVHTVLMLRKLNRNAEIICLAKSEKARELLEEAGATRVIPARILGRLLASAAFEPSVADFLRDVTTAKGAADLIEHIVTKSEEGKTIEELENTLPRKHGGRTIRVIAIIRDGKMTVAPNPQEKVKEGDRLVCLKALQ